MKIHSDDMIRASAGEEVSYQCTSLSYPLTVSDLGLEGWWFGGQHSRETVGSRAAVGTIVVVEIAILLGFVRLDSVAAREAVGLHGAYRIRGRTAAAALVHLHLAKLVVKSGGSIGHASALGLSWVRSLRSRVKCVCTGPRARAWSFRERGASLVVWDIGLAGVGEEGQDGGDALRGSSTAGRNGDEESKRRSGTSYNSIVRMGVLHQVIVDYTRHPKLAWSFKNIWEPFPA
jgi:hypothetical protein